MLLIPRRMGEGILIGDDVFILLYNLNKYGIEVGIDAPRDIDVSRVTKTMCLERKSKKSEDELC